MREGASSSETMTNFDSQMRKLLINYEKGGMYNYFNALYTPEYVDSISVKPGKI